MGKKLIYIIGSSVIGMMALLAVLFGMIGGGAIDAEQTKLVYRSADAEAVYNGTALTCDEWELVDGTLKEGHTSKVVVSGSRTEVGVSENHFSVTVVDERGADVTEYYEIERQVGTLKVTTRYLELTADSTAKVYDGTPLTCHAYTVTDGAVAEGHTVQAAYTGSQTNVGTSANHLSAQIFNELGSDVTSNYNLKCNDGTLTVAKRAITMKSATAEKVYDGKVLRSDAYETVGGSLAAGHWSRTETSTELTNVGQVDNVFTVLIFDGEGNNVNANYEITYVYGTLRVIGIQLTLSTGSATKAYDGTPLICDTWELISGALAAGDNLKVTLPASLTSIGKVSNTPVFYVVNEQGQDVTGNYTVESVPGALEVTGRGFVISSLSAIKVYDGVALTRNEIQILDGELASGDTISAVFTGTQTGVGESKNLFTVTIRNQAGEDVTANYELTLSYGTLTVTKRALTVSSGDGVKVYDGTALENKTTNVLDGSVADGHTLNILITGTQTAAGASENSFTVTVLDQDNVDVTANYDLTTYFGMLTVTARPLTVETQGATKVYDGVALTNESYTVLDELLDGHTLNLSVTGSQLDAGSSENDCLISITDANGNDVSANYAIHTLYGMLTVTTRPLTVETQGATKVYDGVALTNESYTVLGELLDGHTLNLQVLGSQLHVGNSENNCLVSITDADGNDVSANYSMDTLYGTLTVLPRTMVVETASQTKEYDGEAMWNHNYAILSESVLLPGHVIDQVIFPETTITNVGVLVNDIARIVVLDEEGKDVSFDYEFRILAGELSITPRPITIRSDSAGKVYDGVALTCPTWRVVSLTQVLDGHTIEVAVSGERIEVGESPNTIAEVLILDRDGTRQTSNYDITYQEGALVVKDEGQTPDVSGDTILDASGNLSGGSLGDANNPDQVLLEVYSEKTGRLYFRMQSYGDYTGNSWLAGQEYGQLLDGRYSYNYLTGIALKNAGYTSLPVQIKSHLNSQYVLPYYPDTAEYKYDIQTSDVVYGGQSSEYALFCYFYDGYGTELVGRLGDYGEAERLYGDFVRQQYLNVDAETKAYLDQIIAEQQFDPDDPLLISKVAAYVQQAAQYDLKYDRGLDAEENVVIAFLDTYKAGICQHYAASATLLYRALGIPARYTVGVAGLVESAVWTNLTARQAHAWVEIYVDGVGWIPVEVTGSSSDGGSGGGSGGSGGGSGGSGGGSGGSAETDWKTKKYVVRPVDQYMKYDGVSTLYAGTEVRGISELLSRGYTYAAEISGSQKQPGINRECKIVSFTLYDPAGADVTEEFNLTFENGMLQVYLQELTVKTGTASKVYDGTPLTRAEYELLGNLLYGHSIKTLQCVGELTNVGRVNNDFSLIIVDENGQDVSDVYKINRQYGSLEITARELHIVAHSASKVYDGVALTCDGYSVDGELAEGHTMTVTVTGSQTKIGRSQNTVSKIVIVDRMGKDVAMNYKITYQNGELSVTPN